MPSETWDTELDSWGWSEARCHAEFDRLTWRDYYRMGRNRPLLVQSVKAYWAAREMAGLLDSPALRPHEKGGYIVEEGMSVTCAHCHEEVPEGDAHYYVNGGRDTVCAECFLNHYKKCDDCGKWVLVDNVTEIQVHGDSATYEVCTNCLTVYEQCGGCGDYTRYPRWNGDTPYCEDCIEQFYQTCHQCGSRYLEGDMHEHRGHLYCYDCYMDIGNIIKSYHSCCKDSTFYGEGDFHIGIELEVENEGSNGNNEVAEAVQDIMGDGFLFFETDGSLDSGFEIITPPMTPAYFDSRYAEFTNALDTLSRMGMRSSQTDSCGLHIHVGYGAFGIDTAEQELTITKVLLAYEKYWDEVVKFSRRSQYNADRWAGRYNMEDEQDLAEVVKRKGHGARYRAVNLTNYSTVEFRIFKGTLNADSFRATVDFTLALIDAVKDKTITEIHSTTSLRSLLDGFMNDNLDAYMESRGL